MLEELDKYQLIMALRSIFKIIFVTIFLTNAILFIAPSAFAKISRKLQRKYGVAKEMFPWLERDRLAVDTYLFNNRRSLSLSVMVISLLLFAALR